MGSIFKCFKHGYETDSKPDWDKHVGSEAHTVIGKSPCTVCEQPISNFVFEGKQGKKSPAICKDCSKELIKGNKNV